MRKIAIFLTDLGGGGAERVMVNLANGLAARAYEVELLLVKREGVYLSQLSPKVRLIDLGTNKLLLSLPKLVAYLNSTQPENLITALEDTNVVAILARLVARLTAFKKGSVSAKQATKLIVTVHNNLSQEVKGGKGFKRRLVPFFLKWIYPFADSVVAVSKGVAADLESLGIQPQQIQVIYNPILTADFDRLAAAVPAAGQGYEWLIQQEVPVVLGVGRLVPQKNFELLVRAFALARQARPLRLIILGEGSQRAMLGDLVRRLDVAESVVFAGFVSNPLAYMARADLCVLSSDWEGFGNVLVESMGVGTPVVSTDCPSGPNEILAGGLYGQLVLVGQAESLAKAMLTTLDRPMDSTLLRQRAADFSVESVLDEYEKLLA